MEASIAVDARRCSLARVIHDFRDFVSISGSSDLEWRIAMPSLNDRGKAEGRAETKAEALLLVLRGRGLVITDDQRHHILACTDLATLDRWLERAGSVASVDELLT